MDRDTAFRTLGKSIVLDPALADCNWSEIAIVCLFSPDGFSAYGFIYTEGAPIRFSPQSDDFYDAIETFHNLTATETAWNACRLFLTRPDYEMVIAFRTDGAPEWKPTPDNIDTLPARLRPS